jgi:alpha-beta hydrolase superfamily lysophospholipase
MLLQLRKLQVTVLILMVFSTIVAAQSQKDDKQKKRLQKQIFPGATLSLDYNFDFPYPFQEHFIAAKDGKRLNALLFEADSAKGVILYLHGNNGALDKWGKIAETYMRMHYDLFILDYRGYGKSEGKIESEEQLYSDVQQVYDTLKTQYPEDHIVVIGYSMGTGPAAMLAAQNHPQKLILDAPYYSLADAVHHLTPKIDTAVLPFKFNTYQFLQKTTAPVVIFHGDADKVFYYGSSEKLKAYFKPGDQLITLEGWSHFDFEANKYYVEKLENCLSD